MPTAYVTAPRDAAADLAESLVDRRLAACVNVVDCHSTYRWDGEVVDEPEAILVAKTTVERYEELAAWLANEHPYDVPCVERFDADDTLPAFADWIADSVA